MNFRLSGQALHLLNKFVPTDMQGCLTNIVRDDINMKRTFFFLNLFLETTKKRDKRHFNDSRPYSIRSFPTLIYGETQFAL